MGLSPLANFTPWATSLSAGGVLKLGQGHGAGTHHGELRVSFAAGHRLPVVVKALLRSITAHHPSSSLTSPAIWTLPQARLKVAADVRRPDSRQKRSHSGKCGSANDSVAKCSSLFVFAGSAGGAANDATTTFRPWLRTLIFTVPSAPVLRGSESGSVT